MNTWKTIATTLTLSFSLALATHSVYAKSDAEKFLKKNKKQEERGMELSKKWGTKKYKFKKTGFVPRQQRLAPQQGFQRQSQQQGMSPQFRFSQGAAFPSKNVLITGARAQRLYQSLRAQVQVAQFEDEIVQMKVNGNLHCLHHQEKIDQQEAVDQPQMNLQQQSLKPFQLQQQSQDQGAIDHDQNSGVVSAFECHRLDQKTHQDIVLGKKPGVQSLEEGMGFWY